MAPPDELSFIIKIRVQTIESAWVWVTDRAAPNRRVLERTCAMRALKRGLADAMVAPRHFPSTKVVWRVAVELSGFLVAGLYRHVGCIT